MYKDGTQRMCILTSERFLGPYSIVTPKLKPLGMSAGDFDLSVAPDGKGYYYFERVHSETIIADLTEDYTDVTGHYTEHFPHPHPPYVREATAHFIRKDKHFIITSGTTGYFPNPSEVAVGSTWHGPFKVLGNPHPTDETKTSFHSQISSVFKVPGKSDLYVAIADRWRPDLMSVPYELAEELFDRMFGSDGLSDDETDSLMEELREKYGISKEEMLLFPDSAADTKNSDYVWLPLRFIEPCEEYPDGMVYIEWLDEWRLEDYD